MATKKAKPAAASAGKTAARVTDEANTRPAELAAQDAADGQRLLREAAWSRMFGRNDAKNPFAR